MGAGAKREASVGASAVREAASTAALRATHRRLLALAATAALSLGTDLRGERRKKKQGRPRRAGQ